MISFSRVKYKSLFFFQSRDMQDLGEEQEKSTLRRFVFQTAIFFHFFFYEILRKIPVVITPRTRTIGYYWSVNVRDNHFWNIWRLPMKNVKIFVHKKTVTRQYQFLKTILFDRKSNIARDHLSCSQIKIDGLSVKFKMISFFGFWLDSTRSTTIWWRRSYEYGWCNFLSGRIG